MSRQSRAGALWWAEVLASALTGGKRGLPVSLLRTFLAPSVGRMRTSCFTKNLHYQSIQVLRLAKIAQTGKAFRYQPNDERLHRQRNQRPIDRRRGVPKLPSLVTVHLLFQTHRTSGVHQHLAKLRDRAALRRLPERIGQPRNGVFPPVEQVRDRRYRTRRAEAWCRRFTSSSANRTEL